MDDRLRVPLIVPRLGCNRNVKAYRGILQILRWRLQWVSRAQDSSIQPLAIPPYRAQTIPNKRGKTEDSHKKGWIFPDVPCEPFGACLTS